MEKRLILKTGHKGDDVKILQELLNIKVDGVFGIMTRSAVINFQKSRGLKSDGIVGPLTWDALKYSPEEFFADTDTLTGASWIEQYHLPEGQYVKNKTSKKYIFLHHTAGRHNPYKQIDYWSIDQRGRVGTNYVIGGVPEKANINNLTPSQLKYNGRILQAINDIYWGYHLGPNGSSFMTSHSLSIEICNAGALKKKGRDYYTWYGEKVHPSQVEILPKPFRGSRYYHKYTEEQLESLEALLLHLSDKHGINLKDGMQYMGVEKMYEWDDKAYAGKINGLLSHTNVRKDKSDVFPQPELTKMIMNF